MSTKLPEIISDQKNASPYIPGVTGINGFGGTILYDSNVPGNVIAPGVINPYSVLTAPEYWRGMSFLADLLASFPRTITLDGQKPDKPHKLQTLVRKPNGYQVGYQTWRTLFFHWRHFGNGYLYIQRASATSSRILAIHNLLPESVIPFRYDGTQWYALWPAGMIIPAADMIHLSVLAYDGMAGFNPTWLMQETFRRALLRDRFTTRFLSKGSVVRGAIQFPKTLNEDQRQKIRAGIKNYFYGADAENDLLLLDDGATLNNATLTLQDGGIGQLNTFSVKQIAQIIGISPLFLFDYSEYKYNGDSENAYDDLMRGTLSPWLTYASEEISEKLLSDREIEAGWSITFDPSKLLHANRKTMSDTIANEVKSGLRTRNEGRAALGLQADDDPSSDKLSQLGDTTVNQDKPAAPPEPVQSSRPAGDDVVFEAIRPLLLDAAARVDARADKRFEDRRDKSPDWLATFAEGEAKYATQALSPFRDVLAQTTGRLIDVDKLANDFAAGLRGRADGHPGKNLITLLNEVLT